MTPVKQRKSIGQILVDKGLITVEQLDLALRKQRTSHKKLGGVLIEMKFIQDEYQIIDLLAEEMSVEAVRLKDLKIPSECIKCLPSRFATYYKAIPYEEKDGFLKIATGSPTDVHISDELSTITGRAVRLTLTTDKDIVEAIRFYYGVGAETIDQMMDSVSLEEDEQPILDISDLSSEASISKFLNQVLIEAYRERATDVHIEPYEDELKIRYRIDSILYDAKVPLNIVHFKDAIISRIKVLSNLNIAEKRLPQDGRFKVRISGIDLDLRVSTMPTPYGESVVLRLLNSARMFNLHELGLNPDERKILEKLIGKPHGIVFVTGPTGSGKTTSLYACLSQINSDEKKIITIEDPIEYQIKGVTQIQINPQIGLTFAQGLRSMLRHDPDVMMVGEVRDKETAEIAIQVALTGHLIFSTLHTNDAASGVARLLDMGVDPYLITSTVECFIAQRLMRILCPKCKTRVEDPHVYEEARKIAGEQPDRDIYEPKGCDACQGSGYTGREPVFEFLLMTDAIRDLIMERATAAQIKDAAVEAGMSTLLQAAWGRVAQGKSSLAEVIRIASEEE